MGVRIPYTAADPDLSPVYATSSAAGADLRAAITDPVSIPPGGRFAVPTGIRIAIPEGYEGQVRPRSGLALKKGLTTLNAPGTIDADYRGEVHVILVNLGSESVSIERGERIAQLVIAPAVRADFQLTDRLDETDRGEGGFGSTGSG